MWVFDGETWTEDGGEGEVVRKHEEQPLWIEELAPELQVIEILPSKSRQTPPPPFP